MENPVAQGRAFLVSQHQQVIAGFSGGFLGCQHPAGDWREILLHHTVLFADLKQDHGARRDHLLGREEAAFFLNRQASGTVAVFLEGEFGGDDFVDHFPGGHDQLFRDLVRQS